MDCVIDHAVVKCIGEQKRQAVVEFCARGGSVEKIANSLVGALREKYRLKELLSCFKISKSSCCYQEKAMRRPDKYRDLRIVAWSIGTSPNAELVNSMPDEAVSLFGNEERPIVHSDRGGHYRWPGWLERMERYRWFTSRTTPPALRRRATCSPTSRAFITPCPPFRARLALSRLF